MTTLQIDFVSDVACPWCAVGLASFEQAVAQLKTSHPSLQVQVQFQPFELNPQMDGAGQDAAAYLKAKYGMNDAALQEARDRIRQRGAEVGFMFSPTRSWVWNTFDAHRLLFWAGTVSQDAQLSLKRALLAAYHGNNQNPSSPEVLKACASAAGLDAARAAEVITSQEFTAEVRQEQALWQQMGIASVPAVVINRKHLVSGGQPPHVFAQAMRQIAQAA